MNSTENRDFRDRPLTTADLAAAGRRPPPAPDDDEGLVAGDAPSGLDTPLNPATPGRSASAREKLAPLFPTALADDYRSRWAAIQSSFVDDPRQAAQQGDELVAQVMKGLAETFSHEREELERQLNQTGDASTEALRIALRRYRSFFERLLSL